MKALIIGCGYLGHRVADRWVAAGHDVTALTRSAAKAESLRDAGVTPVLGDITDAASLMSLPAVDLVLYAVGYDRSSGDRRAVVVDGLRNVLERVAGKRSGRRDPRRSEPRRSAFREPSEAPPSDFRQNPPHIVFISTTSVYGQHNGEWVDAASPTEPDSEAGRMALEAEELVRKAGMARCMILRLTGLYGPDRLLRRVEQMRAGEPFAGHGDAWLNLIHVDDAAIAVTLAAERLQENGSPSPSGGGPGWGKAFRRSPPPCPPPEGEGKPVDALATFIVTDDRPVRRREYYEHLAKLTGSPPPVFDASEPTRVAGLGKRCRNDAAKRRLGLTLAFPTFVEGLPDAWRRSAASL